MNFQIHTGKGMRKCIVVMKLTLLLIAAFSLRVSAFSQQPVTLSYKNAPLQQVMQAILKQTGYGFIVDAANLKLANLVTIDVKQASLEETLVSVFANQPFTFHIEGKSIVIQGRGEKKNEVVELVMPQERKDLTGKVLDQNGFPLVGATILIKGTKIGAVSDLQGYFRLDNAPDNGNLLITMIGHETIDVSYKNGKIPSIVLKEINEDLNTVQIIAYGTVKKKYNTSNIISVKADVISTQPVQNPLLALSGRVPGLFIQQTTGVSGGAVNVTIQGRNSMLNGNDPFYVVDGVPYPSQTLASSPIGGAIPTIAGSALNYINPSDIESIEILKDADATAIYGSRAANGAILITTKKGRSGATKVDVNMQTGWGKITRKLKLLNTSQYLDLRREAIKNAGASIRPSDYDLNGTWDTTINHDWQEELVGGTAKFTNIQTSLSGGNETTQFFAGGAYNRQTTVYPGDLGNSKANVHFNITHNAFDQKLKFSLTGSYQFDNNTLSTSDLMSKAIIIAPNAPNLYNSDGTLNWGFIPGSTGAYSFANPLAYLLQKYTGKTYNLISNALIGYEIIPGLELKSSLGYNRLSSDENSIIPVTSIRPDQVNPNSRQANYSNKYISSWIIEPQLTYNKNIGNGHFDGLLGTTFQTNENYLRGYNASGFTSDEQLENILAAPTSAIRDAVQSTYRYNAIFGRLNYRYNDRYIINLNARRDGSSRFGSENLFHNFYSIGGAWLFSEETFIKGSIASFLSQGKVRATYGTSGNDQIGDYGFLNLYNPYGVDVPYQEIVGQAPSGHSNPYLQWEETRKLNLGIDLGVLQNRITLNVNYFRNRSSNQLLFYPLLISTGFSYVRRNLPATVQNMGWEFMLDASPIKNRNVTWHSSMNLTIPRNKLVRYDNIESSSFADSYVIGQPTNIIRAFQFVGVNTQTGLYEFRKADGTLTSTPIDPADKTALVNLNPKFYGGFYNDLTYNGFSLSFLFQFVKQTGINYRFGANSPGRFNFNQPESYVNHWRSKGDFSDLQKVTRNSSEYLEPYSAATSSTALYSDASYIRLKNAALSYTLPSMWMQKVHITTARIYLQGQNLLTITNFKGTDPETQGVGSLPPLRMFTLGFQLTL